VTKLKPLKAPFPWFGGKSTVARIVWERFGKVDNYVEPFFGSGAVLLGSPRVHRTETINDADGFVANFWRAVSHDPETVARYADSPVNENDLHARHSWLIEQRATLTARLDGDPEYYDAKIAGWWCWGICCWIGSGWCSGDGPWRVVPDAEGVRQLVHLGDAGQGVNRQLVHLGDAGQGVNRQLVHLGTAGQGVNRQLVHLGTAGGASTGSESTSETPGRNGILDWMTALAERLGRVRVCCGDWSRVCGPTVTVKQGLTAVFLDPPYSEEAERYDRLYVYDSLSIARDVKAWCVENGKDKRLRIALCGYEGEHDMPSSWDCVTWKAKGGYGSQGSGDNANAAKERIWFSPHCLKEIGLFS
jgi:DNA adenine methylase